jgi:hypothetical protein
LLSPTHFRLRHVAPQAAESYIVCRTRGLKSHLFTYLFPQHPPTSVWSQHCSARCCYSSKSIPSCCLVATWSCLVVWGVPASTISITTTSPTCTIRSTFVSDLDQRRLGSWAGPVLHLQPIAFLHHQVTFPLTLGQTDPPPRVGLQTHIARFPYLSIVFYYLPQCPHTHLSVFSHQYSPFSHNDQLF